MYQFFVLHNLFLLMTFALPRLRIYALYTKYTQILQIHLIRKVQDKVGCSRVVDVLGQ